MDWTIVYQVTAFLTVALLAIVATIFVLASSLLGLAVESASKEEASRQAERESIIAKQVEQARTEFEKAAKGTGEFAQTEKALQTLEKQKREFEKETRRTRRGYQVFTTKGGVLYPSIPLLLSLILSTLAWGLSMGTWQLIGPYLWGLSVIALGFSLYRIYFGLKRIESVAVTSEQAALTKMTTALRAALEKHEEARKPKLEFSFRDKAQPFHGKKQSILNIRFAMRVVRGDIARSAEVWFFAPPGFSFPNEKTWQQDKDYSIPSAVTCRQEFQNILAGISQQGGLKLGTPANTGTFTLGYRVFCEGYPGSLEKFEAEIK